ncbi:MAG: integration host factor subunit beta [Endomicrobia bacterium]|nr:integration host factor subunit beta [Bacillota bacterium]MCL1971542.1 integration host factor subunit beta [Endomicrobiia bacterium]
MNKNDIANSLASLLSSKKEADAAVDKVFDEISKALRNGEKVVITGFGSFNMFVTQTKNGRNPKTGEKLMIPPMKKIRFKLSKDFFDK